MLKMVYPHFTVVLWLSKGDSADTVKGKTRQIETKTI